ncbi:DUF6318 family protein [Isoptericola sp. AK164]|uniref:DUF6318 family protein n=1 Tax=Isoptericola sp. AK164 TaxID=3024246 RepID=UPI0024183408|nr:DUF6318 family protein [Isoptericola sp. AK164]
MARTPRHLLQLRPLAAALLGAALLSGCTGDDPAAPNAVASETQVSAPVPESPSAEPSPSPSPSETGPAKPERPAAMDHKDADGAAAAVKYILGLEQQMMMTGDTEEWEAHSHRSCGFCASRLEQARTIAERGDIYTGGEVKATIETIYERDAITGVWPLDIAIREDSTRITDSSGEVLYESERRIAKHRAEIGIRDGEWVLVGIGQIPEASS